MIKTDLKTRGMSMDSLKKETRLLKMFKRMNIKNKKCVEECAFIS